MLAFAKDNKKKKKADIASCNCDTLVYKYKCIYEKKTKADTFNYSISYDDSEDSTLKIYTTYYRYGEPMIGYMLNLDIVRDNKIIDTTFITRGNGVFLNFAFTDIKVKCYHHSDKFYKIPVDTINYNKTTTIILNNFDFPATVRSYTFRCKNQHTEDDLKEIIKLSFPGTYTKSYDLEQKAVKYRDTCDCRLESTDFKEL